MVPDRVVLSLTSIMAAMITSEAIIVNCYEDNNTLLTT